MELRCEADWSQPRSCIGGIALAQYRIFENDDRIIHRASTIDLETGEQFVDSYNFTVVELLKVPFFIEELSDSLSKWQIV